MDNQILKFKSAFVGVVWTLFLFLFMVSCDNLPEKKTDNNTPGEESTVILSGDLSTETDLDISLLSTFGLRAMAAPSVSNPFANGKVRIFSILGNLLGEGTADASGSFSIKVLKGKNYIIKGSSADGLRFVKGMVNEVGTGGKQSLKVNAGSTALVAILETNLGASLGEEGKGYSGTADIKAIANKIKSNPQFTALVVSIKNEIEAAAGNSNGFSPSIVNAGIKLSENLGDTVSTATLQTITVTPVNPSVVVGATQQFTATGKYSDDTTSDITATVTWNSDTASVASINTTGLATGINAGGAAISATSGVISGDTVLTVTAPVTTPTLQSIAVTPANPSIVVGVTQQFTATGTYSDASTSDITSSVTWASDTASVASINSSGLATGNSAGGAAINATSGAISGITILTVTAPVTAPTLQSIAVTPANPSVVVGVTLQFTATGTFSDASTADITASVIWSSGETSATVNASGLATGVAAGATAIKAVLGEISGNTILTVTESVIAPTGTTDLFTWTENGSATVQTATTASFSTQYKTLMAYDGSTLLFEINLDGTIPATYVLNATNVITYTKITPYFIPSTGNVIITENANGKMSGTFQGTGTATNGVTSVAGTFTNIAVTGGVGTNLAQLQSIAVTPVNPSIVVGVTQQFTATGTYSDASTSDITSSVTWASDTASAATINTTGLATGISAGGAAISATSGVISGDTVLTVTAPITSAPTITSFTPTSGVVGTSVIITGTNFSMQQIENTVSFNGVKATVGEASATQLWVTVPATATTGNITVTVGGQTGTSTEGFTVNATPVGSTLSKIAAGYEHSLAIKSDGTLFAWGMNVSGQLGDGTKVDKITPTQITGTAWSAISAGGYHTIALKTDGTLWAWGENSSGQLGDGTKVDKITPTQVAGTTWSAISAGFGHTIALKTDGTLWAWGENSSGELGDGTVVDKKIPTQIAGTTWSAISAGNAYTIALKTDGTIWTWGVNNFGQLGDGTTVDKNIPTQITGTAWSAISAGLFHTIALKTDGTLWTWGWNILGQLGDGTKVDKKIPTQIGTDTNWSAISAGNTHTIALKTDGTLWTWGKNTYGMGDGTKLDKITPTQIAGTTWSAISAVYEHSLAFKTDGTWWAWGRNTNGQLGDGTTVNNTSPTQIVIP